MLDLEDLLKFVNTFSFRNSVPRGLTASVLKKLFVLFSQTQLMDLPNPKQAFFFSLLSVNGGTLQIVFFFQDGNESFLNRMAVLSNFPRKS